MELQLHDKTAVVTGASRGIGLAVSRALAHEGVRVVGAARTITPELQETTVATVGADLSTADGAAAVVDGALAELGGIDILINNVGAGDADWIDIGGFLDVDDQQWRDLFNLNLFSAVWMTRAALPSLLERHGAILNIASINARVPATGPVGYSEAKAALTAFGKPLSEACRAKRQTQRRDPSRSDRACEVLREEFALARSSHRAECASTPYPREWSAPRCGATPPDSAARSPPPTVSATSSSWPPFPSRPAFPQAGSPNPRRWRRSSRSWCPEPRRTSSARTSSSTAE